MLARIYPSPRSYSSLRCVTQLGDGGDGGDGGGGGDGSGGFHFHQTEISPFLFSFSSRMDSCTVAVSSRPSRSRSLPLIKSVPARAYAFLHGRTEEGDEGGGGGGGQEGHDDDNFTRYTRMYVVCMQYECAGTATEREKERGADTTLRRIGGLPARPLGAWLATSRRGGLRRYFFLSLPPSFSSVLRSECAHCAAPSSLLSLSLSSHLLPVGHFRCRRCCSGSFGCGRERRERDADGGRRKEDEDGGADVPWRKLVFWAITDGRTDVPSLSLSLS